EPDKIRVASSTRAYVVAQGDSATSGGFGGVRVAECDISGDGFSHNAFLCEPKAAGTARFESDQNYLGPVKNFDMALYGPIDIGFDPSAAREDGAEYGFVPQFYSGNLGVVDLMNGGYVAATRSILSAQARIEVNVDMVPGPFGLLGSFLFPQQY